MLRVYMQGGKQTKSKTMFGAAYHYLHLKPGSPQMRVTVAFFIFFLGTSEKYLQLPGYAIYTAARVIQ